MSNGTFNRPPEKPKRPAKAKDPKDGRKPESGRLASSFDVLPVCKLCRHRIFPNESREWSTNPMGLVHTECPAWEY